MHLRSLRAGNSLRDQFQKAKKKHEQTYRAAKKNMYVNIYCIYKCDPPPII